MQLSGMLGLLADYGLAERVCREYQVTAEDLESLALLEMENRKLAEERRKANGGS